MLRVTRVVTLLFAGSLALAGVTAGCSAPRTANAHQLCIHAIGVPARHAIELLPCP